MTCLSAGGAPDRSFGRAGTVAVRLAPPAHIHAIASDRRGRVLLAGSHIAFSRHKPAFFSLLRLSADGGLDRRFGSRGRVNTRFSHWIGASEVDVAVDRRDRPLLGGWLREDRFGLARYLP